MLCGTLRFTPTSMFIIAIATFSGWPLGRLHTPQEPAMTLQDLDVGEAVIRFAIAPISSASS